VLESLASGDQCTGVGDESGASSRRPPLKLKPVVKDVPVVPFTQLHDASAAGDAIVLSAILLEREFDANVRACPDRYAPLQLTASSTHSSAGACVVLLLVAGAGPYLEDGKERMALRVAVAEGGRNVFRKERHAMGEESFDWGAAGVGPPLSEDGVRAKKEKLAEKKRRQRANAKARKATKRSEREVE